MKQICSMTDGNSSVSVVKDLAHGWLQHNKHSIFRYTQFCEDF